MTTFACVFVSGYVGYTPAYVRNLIGMLKDNYDGACDFVVLTDQPEVLGMVKAEVAVVPKPPHRYPWWAKVELFKPGRFHGRVCYFDLDVLLWRNVNPIVEFPSRFALVPHAGSFEGKNGKSVVKRFNSSVMVWDAGCCDEIYTSFTTDVMARLWGDQDWIGEKVPHARTMPIQWFPRLSEFDAEACDVPEDARVILCKRPKNVEAAQRWPWFKKAWR